MLDWLKHYARWLHLQWPSGTVEKLPEVRADGSTNLPGVFVAGDLTGIPLLKFALDSGTRAVRTIAAEPGWHGHRRASDGILDLVIVGAGVSGMAAAIEARKQALDVEIVEAAKPFFTLVNFPKGKPIFTYPRGMTPAGDLQVRAGVKEELLRELREQVERAGIRPRRARAECLERSGGELVVHLAGAAPLRARRVLVAIGRSGDFRRLGVPGEERDKVYHRLYDPRDFAGRRALVVGGGDAAVETAIALALGGAHVTLSCRGRRFSRPKPELLAKLEALRRDPGADVAIEHPSAERVTTAAGSFAGERPRAGRIEILLGTQVAEIGEDRVTLRGPQGEPETLPNDVVFVMIGRDPPLELFRRSGIAIAGEMTPGRWAALAAFAAFCIWLYDWKSGGWFDRLFRERHWFPYDLHALLASLGGAVSAAAADPRTLLGTLAVSAAGPAFWYTLAYSLVVVIFGVRRIRRRRTPYVTVQTLTLMAIQVVPLFLLPEVVLPLLDRHGWLPAGVADALFPRVSYGHGREFWRAYGLTLAWPLNVYNIFTHRPLFWWIVIGVVQTLVLIPLGVYFFGKGAYCGWVCSCGALAETLGDMHRHKMPHGPAWNRANLLGQGILAIAVLLLLVRIAGWVLPAGNWADRVFEPLLETPYRWTVDVFLAGVVGLGAYFWYSGRVWCRFLCPLAALMHVYGRFSSFRILAEKKKCISCGQCTQVCHQGIDVMNFANKGLPMADPQCVRCSACVHVCPTGVLEFGRVGRHARIVAVDSLMASPVKMREG